MVSVLRAMVAAGRKAPKWRAVAVMVIVLVRSARPGFGTSGGKA
jgi:hypothetical protein